MLFGRGKAAKAAVDVKAGVAATAVPPPDAKPAGLGAAAPTAVAPVEPVRAAMSPPTMPVAPSAPIGSATTDAAPAASATPASLSEEELRNRAALSKALAASLGEIVAIMMRVPRYRETTLAHIERMVLPAIMTGQFGIAEAQSRSTGASGPVAFVLWASVSDAVDQRLSAAGDAPLTLDPKEWRSGDTIWLVEAIGERRIINTLLKRTQTQTWAGQKVKIRTKDKDGRMQVALLGDAPPAGTHNGAAVEPRR